MLSDLLGHDYYQKPFLKSIVERMIDDGEAICCDNGDLLLGPSHDNEGIKFLVKQDEFYYSLEGEVEGFEYVLNIGATFHYKASFSFFNNHDEHHHDKFIEYNPPKNIRILDARNILKPKYLVFSSGGFGIINKFSTQGFLKTIDQMNALVSYEILPTGIPKVVNNQTFDLDVFWYDELVAHVPSIKK